MKIEKIIDDNLILAEIIRSDDWGEGLNFATSDKDFEQVGFWNYKNGYKLNPHIHLESPRQILKTQEVIFVKEGCLRADIFSQSEKFIKSIELKTGDTAIFLEGGHGYEILQDNTKVLEIKNGPYLDPEKDKRKIQI